MISQIWLFTQILGDKGLLYSHSEIYILSRLLFGLAATHTYNLLSLTPLLALGDIAMIHSDLLGLRRINSSPILLLDEDISRNAPLSAAFSSCWAPIITIRRSSPGFWTTIEHDAGFRGSARRLGEIESDFVIVAASARRDRTAWESPPHDRH